MLGDGTCRAVAHSEETLAAPHELTNLKLEARSKEAEGMTKYVAFSPAEGA